MADGVDSLSGSHMVWNLRHPKLVTLPTAIVFQDIVSRYSFTPTFGQYLQSLLLS
jgi:hypothetical protein